MKRIALTTFSKEGYELYGRRFIKSFKTYWDIPLLVFYRGTPLDKENQWIDMRNDDEYMEFLEQYDGDPVANGVRDKKLDYRFQAVKFCHKVFAQTSPERPECDQWIWVDADVETYRPIDQIFYSEACPKGVVASYLGRKDWHHSECGFMCYNLPEAEKFLQELRRTYVSGELFTLREWHDSYVWDVVRKAVGPNFFNISENIGGTDVWPETILGDYMTHQKGPRKKVEVYGGAL